MSRLIAALGLLLLPGLTLAQQTDSLSQTHAEFMERAYMFKNLPDRKTGEWFQAFLPLHLPLRQNLQGAYDRITRGGREWHSTLSLYFTMMVDLRMTRESSAPVRTPSYMPKFTLTPYRVRRVTPAGGPGTKAVEMWAFPIVPYGHYSNGQDGCLFTFQQMTGAVCTDTSTAPHDTVVNRRDGSFSSHYVQGGVFYRRITIDPRAQAGSYVVGKSFWSAGAQLRLYQPYYWLGGGLSEELRPLYGPTRVRIMGNRVRQSESEKWPGQVRLEGFVEFLPGASPKVDPVRVSAELARTFDKRNGWGVFIRGYSGQDDYNLGFLTNVRVIQLGVTGLGERMPSFSF